MGPEQNANTRARASLAALRAARSELLARLGGQAQGLVTRARLLTELPSRAIDRLVEDGSLVVVHRGVYAPARSPDTFRRRLQAALLASGPGAVASHRAAAHLLGLGDLDPVVEVSVPRSARPRIPGVRAHQQRRLVAADVFVREGIPVTNEARTLCDLALVLDRDALELVLDHSLARRRVTCDQVRSVLARLGPVRGAGSLRGLLDARPRGRARNESPLEQQLERDLLGAGFDPKRQLEVGLPGFGVVRLDFAFPEGRLCVETDGFEAHGTREAFERDRARDVALVAAGWRVLRFTSREVASGRAFERIRAVLSAGRPSGPVRGSSVAGRARSSGGAAASLDRSVEAPGPRAARTCRGDT